MMNMVRLSEDKAMKLRSMRDMLANTHKMVNTNKMANIISNTEKVNMLKDNMPNMDTKMVWALF